MFLMFVGLGVFTISVSACGKKANPSSSSREPDSRSEEKSSSSEKIVEYSINWVNYNDEVLLSERYREGEIPVYKGKTPEKPGDAQYTYTFSRWIPETTIVKEDATYRAYFSQTVNTYTVTWKNYDGSVLDVETYSYGSTPSYKGEEPTKPQSGDCFYVFAQWNKAITRVTENAEYIATFNAAYEVTWKNYDGSVLTTDVVVENNNPSYTGETPIKKDEGGQIAYTFDGWSPEISPVTKKTEYIASFVEGPGFEFQFNGTNGYNLTKCFLTNLEYINIPSSYEGFGVTKINSDVFKNFTSLKRIVVPSTIKTIDGPVFSGCNNLESLTIPFTGRSASGSYSYLGYLFGATSYSNSQSYVPSSLHEVVVQGITSVVENAFYGCSSLVSINLPNTVTSIGNNAFYGCSSLTSINIPSGVKSIGSNAFYGCSSLISLTIPAGVSTLGTGLLKNCFSLTTLTLPEGIKTIDSETFYGCSSLNSISIPSTVTTIKSNAFNGCNSLTSLVIPDTVTTIESAAFSGCGALESITLPFIGCDLKTTNQTSEYYVFGYVFGATSFEGSVQINSYFSSKNHYFYIPGSLRNVSITGGAVHTGAFSGCKYLTSISIPDSVTTIESYAFYSCTSLTSISIPDSLTTIESYAFYSCTSLTSISLPNVKSIYSYAFSGCSSMETIDVDPLKIVSLGEGVYRNCSSLTTAIVVLGRYSLSYYFGTVPSSLKSVTISRADSSIAKEAFSGCRSIKSFTMYNRITSIGQDAFKNCTANLHYYGDLTSWSKISGKNYFGSTIDVHLHLDGDAETTSINLPDETYSISSYAFYSCTSLVEVSIPGSVSSIGTNAFYRCNLEINYYGTLEKWLSITGKINLGSSNKVHLFFDGSDEEVTTIIVPNGTTSLDNGAFYNCSSLTSITIPDGVTSVGSSAFYGCTSLSSVTIPDGVTDLYGSMLDGSSVTTINIPGSLKYIRSGFSNCPSLTDINYHGTLEQWLNIGTKNNFDTNACIHLFLDGSDEEATSIVVPDSYTSLPSYAFYGCKALKSIVVPNSVTYINSFAFYGCSYLETISVPFVGSGKPASYSPPTSTMFGYIFGTLEYENAYEVTHYEVISESALGGSGTYYIPNSLKNVIVTGDSNKVVGGFSNMSSLESVEFPDTMTSIDGAAFYYCTSLHKFDIPSAVTSIGMFAFYNTGSFENITIPEGVTRIEPKSFFASGVKTITFPNTLKTIGSVAFRGCRQLESIYLPDSVYSIESGAFMYCNNIKTLHLSNSLSTIARQTFSYNSSLEAVDIPNGVRSIGYLAFSSCRSLKTLTLSKTVASIDTYAFEECTALESVTFYNSSCSIGVNAFYDCRALKDVTFIGSIDRWLAANDYSAIFSFGRSFHFYLDGDERETTNIKIPTGVTSISSYAFVNFPVETIIVPTSVTSIGYYAFAYTDSLNLINNPYLQYVFYEGSKLDYSAIDISSDCGFDLSIVYFYSETEPTESGNYWHYVNEVPTIWNN